MLAGSNPNETLIMHQVLIGYMKPSIYTIKILVTIMLLILQGDLPNIQKDALTKIVYLLDSSNSDISTLGVKISSDQEILNPNIVKAYVRIFQTIILLMTLIVVLI